MIKEKGEGLVRVFVWVSGEGRKRDTDTTKRQGNFYREFALVRTRSPSEGLASPVPSSIVAFNMTPLARSASSLSDATPSLSAREILFWPVEKSTCVCNVLEVICMASAQRIKRPGVFCINCAQAEGVTSTGLAG